MRLPAGKGGENTFFLQGSLSSLDRTVVAQFLDYFQIFFFNHKDGLWTKLITESLGSVSSMESGREYVAKWDKIQRHLDSPSTCWNRLAGISHEIMQHQKLGFQGHCGT